MKLIKTLLAAAAMLTAGTALADIKIGVSLPLTGPASGLGIPMNNYIKLWPQSIAGEKLVVTVDHHGNTSAASIPLALDEAVRAGRIQAGHKVLFEGVGGGFTWGAILAQM